MREVVDEYELYSLNFVLGELGNIWAFRYPEKNPLLLYRREAGGASGDAELDHADAAGMMRLHSDDAADTPLVVIASEQISEEPGWEEIANGELIHVGPDLSVDRETIGQRTAAPPDGAERPCGENAVIRVSFDGFISAPRRPSGSRSRPPGCPVFRVCVGMCR